MSEELKPLEEELSNEVGEVLESTCYNCANTLNDSDKFCAACGQKRGNSKLSFGQLIQDFLGDFFNWDSKFFRSIIPLAIRPGFLTQEFMHGKRIRYIPPIRLYIFLSVIYFLILSISGNSEKLFNLNEVGNSIATINTTEGDSVVKRSIFELDELEENDLEELQAFKDSLFQLARNETDSIEWGQANRVTNGWILMAKGLGSQEIIDSLRITSLFHQQIIVQSAKLKENPKTYIQNTVKNISILLFILMPIFALILKLLYLRRKFFYTEHLIFSFHYHAFIFLILFLVLLASQWAWLMALLILYIWVYLFFALKKVYKQSFIKTLIKYLLLQWLYVLVLFIGITATFAITFYLF